MLSACDNAGVAAFVERLAAWQQKALREAKLETDWTAPNASYENAARDFLLAVMAPGSRSLGELADLARRIGPAGAVNGLAQTMLKLTTPGVPDFFQGGEFWDLSLVDPDNRRPVDFSARIEALRAGAAPVELVGSWRDGRVKQALIARVLAVRRAAPEVFLRGDYHPIAAHGPCEEHVVAFARRHGDAALLTVVPRLPSRLLRDDDAILIPPDGWRDTVLELPDEFARECWHDPMSGRKIGDVRCRLPVSEALAAFPVAVLCTASVARGVSLRA